MMKMHAAVQLLWTLPLLVSRRLMTKMHAADAPPMDLTFAGEQEIDDEDACRRCRPLACMNSCVEPNRFGFRITAPDLQSSQLTTLKESVHSGLKPYEIGKISIEESFEFCDCVSRHERVLWL